MGCVSGAHWMRRWDTCYLFANTWSLTHWIRRWDTGMLQWNASYVFANTWVQRHGMRCSDNTSQLARCKPEYYVHMATLMRRSDASYLPRYVSPFSIEMQQCNNRTQKHVGICDAPLLRHVRWTIWKV
ncbi:hypothetical protein HanPSC8_Chr17g0778331 [Helianthus annuus]|nr:hypothetical protein HanPSC8_Chr17g0778331 [Helianthus annuus]